MRRRSGFESILDVFLLLMVVSSATAVVTLLNARGKSSADEEWWWDYLDMQAQGVLKIILDDSILLVEGLSGREALLTLFSPHLLQALSTTSEELFCSLLEALSRTTGNSTCLRLTVEGEGARFDGGDILGDERVVREASLGGGVEVKVSVGWGVSRL